MLRALLTFCAIATTWANAAPVPLNASPAAGSGFSQTFTFQFSDSTGWQNLVIVNVLINNVLDGRHACYVAFVPSGAGSGSVFLVDDAGDAGGPYSGMVLPGSGTVQNSQCAIAASGSSVSANGTTLTLILAITFTSAFSGNKVAYLSAREAASNSGWQAGATWSVPGNVPNGPAAGGVNPAASSQPGQTYTFTFTDPRGWQDLSVVNVLINSAINGVSACYVAFVPAGPGSGMLYLVDDAGDAAGPYSGTLLPGSGTVANSQCSISGANSSVSASGTMLTLTLAITFTPAFSGNQIIYLAARSTTQNSDWQAVGIVTAVGASPVWSGFSRDAQHTATSSLPSQPLNRIHWQTPVDLNPQFDNEELLIHYGSPLVTAANTVIVPVKTGADGGFRVDAHAGSSGDLLWSLPTDYILPPHDWIPEYGATLTPGSRLYYPGAGGTVYFRDQPDSATGPSGQIAFYGIADYRANQTAYDSAVMINTPITSGPDGSIYFGFEVIGPTPQPLESGIARIDAAGHGTWVAAAGAAGDPNTSEVVQNCAPALNAAANRLYFAVSDGVGGYLLALDATTLQTVSKVRLSNPTGTDSLLFDSGTASPTIGPDGDVYYGVLDLASNHGRGWLLHFDATLAQSKTPGSFGWDDTASVVPASMVPSYTGTSGYLLMTKYNDYVGEGGTGLNRLAILDPNATQTDPVTGVTVMKEVLTVLGPTSDGDEFGVKEWCINSAAVDPATKSVLANNEDGKAYRWDLTTNTLSQSVTVSTGLGEAYTPTIIGADGTVYVINNGTLFALGQ